MAGQLSIVGDHPPTGMTYPQTETSSQIALGADEECVISLWLGVYIDSSLHTDGRQLLDIKLVFISEPACPENECHMESRTIAAGVLERAFEKSGWAFAIGLCKWTLERPRNLIFR